VSADPYSRRPCPISAATGLGTSAGGAEPHTSRLVDLIPFSTRLAFIAGHGRPFITVIARSCGRRYNSGLIRLRKGAAVTVGDEQAT
jgi:hypothetical protein